MISQRQFGLAFMRRKLTLLWLLLNRKNTVYTVWLGVEFFVVHKRFRNDHCFCPTAMWAMGLALRIIRNWVCDIHVSPG